MIEACGQDRPISACDAMATQTEFVTPDRHAEGQARAALRFFAIAAGVGLLASLVTLLALALFGTTRGPGRLFPPAFLVSTSLLAAGSFSLARAVHYVRRERQRSFRRWLLTGLIAASLFVGVQAYGLAWMLPNERTAQAASTGVIAFVMALTTMHAMHVVVASLFLSLVTVRSFAERYDHEYYWGVSVCAWFWHVLGIVWLAILAVFAIAA
jgi:cytochrome c oxidase subunit III